MPSGACRFFQTIGTANAILKKLGREKTPEKRNKHHESPRQDKPGFMDAHDSEFEKIRSYKLVDMATIPLNGLKCFHLVDAISFRFVKVRLNRMNLKIYVKKQHIEY